MDADKTLDALRDEARAYGRLEMRIADKDQTHLLLRAALQAAKDTLKECYAHPRLPKSLLARIKPHISKE